jgi:hypothetical protein
MGLFGRKRMKTTDAQGRKVVVVTDKRGTVRKTKIKDKKNQITTKERYDRSGDLTKRKAKGKYIKRFKAKTSNPRFDQSVFQSNQQVKNLVSGNPILNTMRNNILTNGTDDQKKVQNTEIKNDNTQTNTENTNTENTETKNTETKTTDNKNKSNDVSFSQAYRTQRDKNTEAGIDHYGDEAGYFTWKGKEYNTESKSEKENRLKPKETDVINTSDQGTDPEDSGDTPPDNTNDKGQTGENETETEEVDDTPVILDENDGYMNPELREPTDSVPSDTIKKMEINRSDTLARRGGSKGSYGSFRRGGAVGPNGVL